MESFKSNWSCDNENLQVKVICHLKGLLVLFFGCLFVCLFLQGCGRGEGDLM